MWRRETDTLRDTVTKNPSSDVPSSWKRSQRLAQVGHSYAMEQVTTASLGGTRAAF